MSNKESIIKDQHGVCYEIIISHMQNMMTACQAGNVGSLVFFMMLAELAISGLAREVAVICPEGEKTTIDRLRQMIDLVFKDANENPDVIKLREKLNGE